MKSDIHKIDINNFHQTEFLAKLLTLTLNYQRKADELLEDKAKFMEYCKKVSIENFTFQPKQKELLIHSVGLFLLGNKDNALDRMYNKISIFSTNL
jgi:hypothetical protein